MYLKACGEAAEASTKYKLCKVSMLFTIKKTNLIENETNGL